MAVVGKGFAVLQAGKVRMSGFLAWLGWAGVHLEFLAQSNLRVSVFLQWVWTYVTEQRGSRLILDNHGAEPATAVSGAALGDPHPTKSAAARAGRTIEVRLGRRTCG